MSIVIRTDSSVQIGSGHVMRCLTLADEMRRRGSDVTFICREQPGNLISIIKGKGYPVVPLKQTEAGYAAKSEDVAYAAWLGIPWERDAADTVTAVGNKHPQWLIVDHYALDRRWEKTMRPHVGKILVIDDLADRLHDCDLLLDQNLCQDMETRYKHLIPGDCNKLIGPRYALLRPEFAAARKKLRRRDGQIRRILVFFGSVDPTNETEKAIQALVDFDGRKFEVDVVVGSGNPYKWRIQNLCETHDGFHYHCQVDNMAELMDAADVAIGAGGTATWERCAMGVPSIIIAVADNQKELAKTGALNGLFFYLGEKHSVSSECLLNVLKSIFCIPETMKYYSENCLRKIDTKGTARVTNLLFPPEITIRRASLGDCDNVYEWRNAEETRRYIFNSEAIPLESHINWFRKSLENPNRILLIGEVDNKPVGVLRYDITDNNALISVYLVPGGQGQGVGAQLIRSGSQWVRVHYPNIRMIRAEIFKENIASLRAFESAGYEEHHRIIQEALK